ncbi:30S ribosomal protein S16 [candidate division WOR-3 bacterium]|nr:30S ribosomal protein S16 [candidate division WOR-3 bacterium]
MSVRIHLARFGKRSSPFYHIVVADKRHRRDGKCLEKLGYYDPRRPSDFNLDIEKINKWIQKGASVTETVSSLIRRHKKEQPQ